MSISEDRGTFWIATQEVRAQLPDDPGHAERRRMIEGLAVLGLTDRL